MITFPSDVTSSLWILSILLGTVYISVSDFKTSNTIIFFLPENTEYKWKPDKSNCVHSNETFHNSEICFGTPSWLGVGVHFDHW